LRRLAARAGQHRQAYNPSQAEDSVLSIGRSDSPRQLS
jgi:hypothetical protein